MCSHSLFFNYCLFVCLSSYFCFYKCCHSCFYKIPVIIIELVWTEMRIMSQINGIKFCLSRQQKTKGNILVVLPVLISDHCNLLQKKTYSSTKININGDIFLPISSPCMDSYLARLSPNPYLN